MTGGLEALFTQALGLQAPWSVTEVALDTVRWRIDFTVSCNGPQLACPQCGTSVERIDKPIEKQWRHLDFFQFEAWLSATVPSVSCAACGRSTQADVPWAKPGSGFTLLFEVLSRSQGGRLQVSQAASLSGVASMQTHAECAQGFNVTGAAHGVCEASHSGAGILSTAHALKQSPAMPATPLQRLLSACAMRFRQTLSTFDARPAIRPEGPTRFDQYR